MKKIIAMSAALVLLTLGGLGAFAYAQSTQHEAAAGQKLVGWGPVGVALGAEPSISVSLFNLTNPDCINTIRVDRISVFKDDGTVIYEGPPIVGGPGEALTELADPLQPHQSVIIFLPLYVIAYELGISPLDLNNIQPLPVEVWPGSAYYSAEIFWTGARNGLPLTGWIWIGTIVQDSGGNYTVMSTSAMGQMVNMEQILAEGKK